MYSQKRTVFHRETPFIICSVLAPVLSLYSNHGISLAILAIVISYIYMTNTKMKFLVYNKFALVLLIYILFNCIVVMLQINSGALDILLRTLQYMVCIFIPMTISSEISYDKLRNWYLKIALIAALFLIVQYLLLNVTGIYISGLVSNPIFPPSEDIVEIQSKTLTYASRVTGLFSEPAAHAVYVVGALAISLFDEKVCHRVRNIVIYGLSLFMCVSSTGIITAIIVIIIFIVYQIYCGKISKSLLLGIASILVVIILLMNTSFGKLFIYRIQDGTSATNRMSAYEELFGLGIMQAFFGNGMNLESLIGQVYYAGYPRYIYYFGLIGMALWISMVIKYCFKKPIHIKIIAITMLILSTGESTLLGFAGYLLLLLIAVGSISQEYKNIDSSY